jgi:hypothetical protein
MRIRSLAASCVFLLATVASAADPQLLNLVMPDAKVLSGFNVDQIRVSPFGQFILSQMMIDSGFNELVSVTGFDPRRDVHEVVMASPGDPQRKVALLVVRATFDSARVVALAQSSGVTPENYHGAILLTPGKKEAIPHGVAFLDNAIVIAGDLDSVRAAIDRRGTTSGLSTDVLNKVTQTSAGQDAWIVSSVPFSSLAAVAPDRNVKGALQGDLLKSVEQASGSLRFGNIIEVNGELAAHTAQDASSLADVLRFLLNLAQSSASGQAAQFATLLKSLTVSAQASAVKLSVSIPETDLETLFKLASTSHQAAGPRI